MKKVTIRKQNVKKLSPRADRWVNERNRFGAGTDPVSRTTFFNDVSMNRQFLESLFRYDWVTRRAVEIPAQDATREWITLRHDNPKRIQDAERELDRLGLQSKIKELMTLARLYGGGLLVVGAWDGRAVDEPLGIVRRLNWLAGIDRYLGYPLTFYRDKEEMNYGEVETYQISRPMVQGSDVAVVHESRIIRMDGLYLPPMERIRNFTYGASVVENILEASRQFGICSQSLAGVVQDFVVKKLKVANLAELLENDEGTANLMTRIGELAAGMSIHGVAVFGQDEEFEKMGTPVTGLHEIADRFVEYVSAATGIPRARFFNNLSGKLGGDSGENDLRMHYDNIASFQKNELRQPIQKLIDICLAPIGFEPGEMEFDFAPLWQLSEKEMAETRKTQSDTDRNYIETGVVQPEEVAMSRFAGDGVNLDDMHIEEAPRKKFLKQFAKAETRTYDPDNPDGTNPPAEDDTGEGAEPKVKANGKEKPDDGAAAKH